eukprot:TRINITY_DN11379_c0_g1_i1.p2 TRINITY_DN11379_c0_g1~~TRINITY_DN11379_c0_g1_i1.p2  ORF type:complete len:125 (-),score=18.13 TRINITY_DN11379_c0_g1_i1:128-451(-)
MATKATEGGVAGHEEAQSADLATAFMMFVRRCPGVTRSIQEFVVENAPAFASLGESDEHRSKASSSSKGLRRRNSCRHWSRCETAAKWSGGPSRHCWTKQITTPSQR